MIGNDIVDLQQSRVENNWLRKGWLDKVFTADEIALVHNECERNPELMVWLLWSMKEAAYKVWNRTTRVSCFSPKSFACSFLDYSSFSGTVSNKGELYTTSSLITTEFIHTVATATNNLASPNVYFSDADTDEALPANLSLLKDEHGMPFIRHESSSVKNIASKSHHGRFQAIVYC